MREREFVSAWFQGRVQGTITRYPSSASPTLSRRPTFRLRARLAQFGPERPLLPLSPTSPTFQPSRYTFSFYDMIPIFTPASSLTPTPGDSPSSSGHSSPAAEARTPPDRTLPDRTPPDPTPTGATPFVRLCHAPAPRACALPGVAVAYTPLQLEPITVLGV